MDSRHLLTSTPDTFFYPSTNNFIKVLNTDNAVNKQLATLTQEARQNEYAFLYQLTNNTHTAEDCWYRLNQELERLNRKFHSIETANQSTVLKYSIAFLLNTTAIFFVTTHALQQEDIPSLNFSIFLLNCLEVTTMGLLMLATDTFFKMLKDRNIFLSVEDQIRLQTIEIIQPILKGLLQAEQHQGSKSCLRLI